VTLTTSEKLHVGDVVEMELTLPHAGMMSLLVFAPPLVGLLGGGALGNMFLPSSDAGLVALGAAGFALGLIVVALVGRLTRFSKPRAEFVRKVSP
jgi:positive regulator of sigma E activity